MALKTYGSFQALKTQEDGSGTTPLLCYIQTVQVYSVTDRGLGQDPSHCPKDSRYHLLNSVAQK